MRTLRWILVPAIVLFATAAEIYSYDRGDLALAIADGIVGVVLVACGALAWARRPESRVGLLMVIAGVTWFAGNFAPGVLYLHRGPLVHLHISYPTGRLRRRFAQATVVVAYIYAVVDSAVGDVVTVAVAVLVAAAASEIFLRTSGTARRAGIPALVAALGFAGVLALGAIQRMAGWDAAVEVLWTYYIVIACLVVVLLVDLLRGRWADAVVTDLVVDLGDRADTTTLGTELGRALGDRSLVLAYWLPEEERYVDDAGQTVDLPEPGAARVATPIARDGAPIGMLVHDQAVLEDQELLDAVAAAASLAVSNARLQAEVRARVVDLATSRRRVVEAADRQRRRLESELQRGAERRLDAVRKSLSRLRAVDGTREVEELETELEQARTELTNFAQGIYPRSLTIHGLAALTELAERSGLDVDVNVPAGRFASAIEAAGYFLCSEALANVAKHAQATRVAIDVSHSNGRLFIAIVDHGVGGADSSKGSGLRGLADRVEALGGELSVRSPTGAGTRLEATIPVTPL